MAEPTLCSFLTKVLCAHGGRMFLRDLRVHVELSEARLRAVLRAAGPERFLLQDVAEPEPEGLPPRDTAEPGRHDGQRGGGGGVACRVVAVSAARLCARYQRSECRACDQLHLCRRLMQGKCPHRDCWSTCALSHDIHTPGNIQVLKNYGLFGLNEAQLQTLLMQNDPSLFPEVCLLYNRGEALYGYCQLKDKCHKVHVCRAFIRGQCKQKSCKRSHQLVEATSLEVIEDQGLNLPSVVNFQIIASYKHAVLHNTLEGAASSISAAAPDQGPGRQGTRGAGVAQVSLPVSTPAAKERGPVNPKGRR
ncbi:zinc finger CCCH-type antiviral protein 1-like [Echinops telfairi]|uniref:Zinc finger CCCH-type antiviral protein 1-like n=1 Tax=Echinops telfairi TaxID=9371 RepID=A0AC55CZE4_ECHTE|nr:zinc finger CCCH-type antiviral protein 1-like [Echinops telfairi]